MDIQDAEQRQVELGVRTHQAVTSLLTSIAEMAAGPGAHGDTTEATIRRALQPVMEELSQINGRLGELEFDLRDVRAGIRRIDKFTIKAFQELPRTPVEQIANGMSQEAHPHHAREGPRYVRKDETIRLSLQAAREILEDGERVSMAAVARRAGLTYSQVVYAFGRTKNLLQQLREAGTATEVSELVTRDVLTHGTITYR